MLEILWVVGTLAVVGTIGSLSKRWGPSVLIALVVTAIVTANILATKVIVVFVFTVPAGVIVYATSFMLTDTLSEFFGKRDAYKAVFLGFLGNLLFLGSLAVALQWPHAFGPEADEAFVSVLGLSARVTIASLLTYLVSQPLDVAQYAFWRRVTGGRHMWLRNNASTAVSQSVDSVMFVTIAFLGVFPVWPLILGQLAVKVFVAGLDTVVLYLLRYFVFGPEWTPEKKEAASAPPGDPSAL